MKISKQKTKVFVGLSGGVDSSVAAALLQQQGFDVTGVFIKIWQPKWGPCGWKDDRRDAMRVATQLGIPFKTLDLSKEYQKDVADYMIREYKFGRTPNPDVMCNSQIKFGAFLRWARKQGADYIATGHYARMGREILNSKHEIPKKFQIPNSKFQRVLLAGKDKSKDQSYFLWQLKQSQLKYCLFPIGEYAKSEVRKMAKKFKLPTADKPDSQGICFVGKVGMKEFLKKYIKAKKGNVLNLAGNKIGHHDGAFFLTIGQRRGFTITSKGTDDKPYYIVSKDIKKNAIVVANASKQSAENSQQKIIINKISWIGETPVSSKKYKTRFRHLQELKVCKVYPVSHSEGGVKKLKSSEYKIEFSKSQVGVAPGQSLVLYDGQKCLGGGILTE